MTKSSQDFSLKVDGVNGLCPSGEAWTEKDLSVGKIPAFFVRVYASGVKSGVLLQIWSQRMRHMLVTVMLKYKADIH